jgi:hypothetical protein
MCRRLKTETFKTKLNNENEKKDKFKGRVRPRKGREGQ